MGDLAIIAIIAEIAGIAGRKQRLGRGEGKNIDCKGEMRYYRI